VKFSNGIEFLEDFKGFFFLVLGYWEWGIWVQKAGIFVPKSDGWFALENEMIWENWKTGFYQIVKGCLKKKMMGIWYCLSLHNCQWEWGKGKRKRKVACSCMRVGWIEMSRDHVRRMMRWKHVNAHPQKSKNPFLDFPLIAVLFFFIFLLNDFGFYIFKKKSNDC